MATPYAGRRLLALFPHPDDEAYAAGGTLAAVAAGGGQVTVGCATRGEKGSSRLISNQPLATIRTRELQDSCRILGVEEPVFLELPDSGIVNTDSQAATVAVATMLEEIQPHVVLTLGRDGVYGSLDHIAFTRIVDAAAAQVSNTPRLLHTAFARDLFRPVWRGLHRRRPDLVSEIAPPALGTDAEKVDLSVDIRAWRQRKVAALAAHASQLRDEDPYTFLRPGILDRLLETEWFVHVSGAPLPNLASHPFEGL